MPRDLWSRDVRNADKQQGSFKQVTSTAVKQDL